MVSGSGLQRRHSRATEALLHGWCLGLDGIWSYRGIVYLADVLREGGIADFNDRPDRTVEEVVHLLRHAGTEKSGVIRE